MGKKQQNKCTDIYQSLALSLGAFYLPSLLAALHHYDSALNDINSLMWLWVKRLYLCVESDLYI